LETISKRKLQSKDMIMLRILLCAAAVTVLALSGGSAVEAYRPDHSSYSHGGHRTFYHQGHSFYSHYYEHGYRGWSQYCWFPSYRCYGYYCPTRRCWYYWYSSENCYLPVSYMSTFVPAPVNFNQNQNQSTNVNLKVNGGSGLPVGATPLVSNAAKPGIPQPGPGSLPPGLGSGQPAPGNGPAQPGFESGQLGPKGGAGKLESGASGAATDPFATGKKVFAAFNCARCHGAIGSSDGRTKRRGPDLSRIGATHSAESLRAFISNPQSQRPDSPMPAFGNRMSAGDLRALSEYLASLK
jgi:mono/diheme cytochrome c family protein